MNNIVAYMYIPKADPAPAHQARAPWLKICKNLFLKIVDCRTRKNSVINMQCLQCVFYSLLLLQKHRVCIKGHKKISRPKKLYCSGSKISGSATAYVYIHIVYLYHSKIIMLPLEVNKLIDGILFHACRQYFRHTTPVYISGIFRLFIFQETTPGYISGIPCLFIFQEYHACLYFRHTTPVYISGIPRRVIFQAYHACLYFRHT